MDLLIIFGAKYLYILSLLILAIYFYLLPVELRKKAAIFVMITFAITYALGIGARALYDNPRPFVVGGYEPLIAHEADNGFPSDHMLLLSAVASVMLVYNKRVSVVLWIIALLVGVSRVVAGIHHPVDIIASIVIALVSSLLVYKVLASRQVV